MPIISLEETARLWSIARLADAFEVDRATVKRRLLAAGIEPVGQTANGHPAYRLKTAAGVLCDPPPRREIDPATLGPRDRYDFARALETELRIDKLRGQLIPAMDCLMALADLAKTVVAVLETLPDRLERDAALLPAQIDLVERTISDLRSDLYERVKADAAAG